MSAKQCADSFDKYLRESKAIQERNLARRAKYRSDLAKWEADLAEAKREYAKGWRAENKGSQWIEYDGKLYNCMNNTYDGCCQDASRPHQKCERMGKHADCGCATIFCKDSYCKRNWGNEKNADLNSNFKQSWYDNQLRTLNARKPKPPNDERIPPMSLICQDCRSNVQISDSKNLNNIIINQKSQCIATLQAKEKREREERERREAEARRLREEAARKERELREEESRKRIEDLKSSWFSGGNLFTNFFSSIYTAIVNFFSYFYSMLGLTSVFSWIGNAFSYIWSWISYPFVWIYEQIRSLF